MEKILISACLVGEKVRYDKKSSYNPLVKELLKNYELVPFCPEVEGGLKCPRAKSEIRGNKVINEKGVDVTDNFETGAKKALQLCKLLNIRTAILKEFSPSCGKTRVYNGYFEERVVMGQGLTAKLLIQNNIKVYSDQEINLLLKEKGEKDKFFEEKRKEREQRFLERKKQKEEIAKKKEEFKPKDFKNKEFKKKEFKKNDSIKTKEFKRKNPIKKRSYKKEK